MQVLELLQTWGMAFRSSPKYRIVTDTLNLMKAEGWKFPPVNDQQCLQRHSTIITLVQVREAEAMFEADTAPQWAAGEVCHRYLALHVGYLFCPCPLPYMSPPCPSPVSYLRGKVKRT